MRSDITACVLLSEVVSLRLAKVTVSLEDRCELYEEGIALIRALAELCGSALVGDLQGAERRLVSVDERELNVATVDGGVGLQEQLHEQIRREELLGSQDVDPGVLILRIRVPSVRCL